MDVDSGVPSSSDPTRSQTTPHLVASGWHSNPIKEGHIKIKVYCSIFHNSDVVDHPLGLCLFLTHKVSGIWFSILLNNFGIYLQDCCDSFLEDLIQTEAIVWLHRTEGLCWWIVWSTWYNKICSTTSKSDIQLWSLISFKYKMAAKLLVVTWIWEVALQRLSFSMLIDLTWLVQNETQKYQNYFILVYILYDIQYRSADLCELTPLCFHSW